MKATVLAYHSHNIAGGEYCGNDHVALAADLVTLTEAGAKIIPLREIAEHLAAGRITGEGEALAGLSFDDGPVFDFEDFVHPQLGPQRGFLNILRDFQERHGAAAQPGLHATSFVIASPDARAAMERAEDCGYPYLQEWLGDRWWKPAVDSGLMAIGNHSWDHVHHAPAEIATSQSERDDFMCVDNYRDADREIRAASELINAKVDGRCDLFAFPFGHANEYLVRDYLPRHVHEHGMHAAFGCEGRQVRPGDSVWNIPRAVCGHDWKTPQGLLQLVLGPG